MNIKIPSPNLQSINVVDYPSAGVGPSGGCTPVSVPTIVKQKYFAQNSSSSATSIPTFPRINSFSACKLANNSSLIAISSQESGVTSLPATDDPNQLAIREASQVSIIWTPLDNYASSIKRAFIAGVSSTPITGCIQGSINITIDIDDSTWADNNLEYIWPLNGSLAGVQFKIAQRLAPNVWVIFPISNSVDIHSIVDKCFDFIAYGDDLQSYPTSLNLISPLPYITVNGLAVSAVNAQIATNEDAPTNSSPYVYVIAEAPVNGAYQLFFYSFKLDKNYEVFGWQQLTFNGENRNAKIRCDSNGNLHITWESTRCQPSQIYYGVLGPDSREITNDLFASTLDKQIQQGQLSVPALMQFNNPTALDLRDFDEYGMPIESSQWTRMRFNNGGVHIVSNANMHLCGNPKTSKFAAFATLNKDENDIYFDGMFSELSYQISFILQINASTETFTPDEIQEEFVLFKEMFATASSADNINVYTYNGHTYNIEPPKVVYENIIPFCGSYKNNGYEQITLKHYILVAVPEKVRFIAKSINGGEDVHEEYYTGNFKLGIIFETSANISDQANAFQKNHWVRLFGDPIAFNSSHSYVIAVHYSHLRQEGVNERAYYDLVDPVPQNIRFSGDIIVAVDNKVKLGETFIPDFSDGYLQFDIGLGCATVGEFRTLSLNPFDGSTNDDIHVDMFFRSTAIGPHSIIPQSNLVSFAATDRNVSRIVVLSDADEFSSLTTAEESWNTQDTYLLNFGLNRQKFSLTQLPITFVGRNTSPSLTIDNCDLPHIVYQSNRDGVWEIYYTSFAQKGLPFRFDTRITNSPSDSLKPTVSVDGHGRRLVAWHDNRDGIYQIYAARSLKSLCYHPCINDQFIDEYGLTEDTTGYEYDPYIDLPGYANLCQINLDYANVSNEPVQLHFIINLYSDSNFTSLFTTIDSRVNISGWYVNGIQIPYDGWLIQPGEVVQITYVVSKEDNISGEVYFVEFETDDGIDIRPLKETSIYFCPIEQKPRCIVPVVYRNSSSTTENVHFRVTVYRDEELTQSVLSVSTLSDVNKWVVGQSPFPTPGISVQKDEMISVIYNPEFLNPNDAEQRDGSVITSLVCGTTYWVIAESYVNGTYLTVDSYAINCACSDIDNYVWRKDNDSDSWICSGQGKQDIRITKTSSNALFPQSAASQDGIVYMAWEDYRYPETATDNSSYIYYCVWDAKTDIFYSSAQGFKDREVSPYNRYRPITMVNNMQHITFLFSDGNMIYQRACSLYKSAPALLSSSSAQPGHQGVFNETPLTMDASCLSIQIYKDDVVNLYHQDSITPIALVEKPQVRFDIVGPPGTYSVRFKNETDNRWSDWLNILPKLVGWPSSSSGGYAERGRLNGVFIGDDRFVIPWVLSAGSGNKTVTCQALTYNGVSPEFSVNVITRYKELQYKIEFFKDVGMLIPVSSYNGIPILSQNVITILEEDVSSLDDTETTSNYIYIKVTFDDVNELKNALNLAALSRFGGNNSLTYNVYTQGFNQFGLPLTATTNGVYTGSFEIDVEDGIDNQDGEGVIVVNIPGPIYQPLASSSSASCAFNLIKPSDIKASRQQDVDTMTINLQEFKLKYDQELLCQFTSNQCLFYNNKTINESTDDTEGSKPTSQDFLPSCDVYNWISPMKGEVGFYLPVGGENATSWTIVSPIFEIDFSNPSIDYLQFFNCSLDDVLILIRQDEDVVSSVVLTSSSSSATSNSTDNNYEYDDDGVFPYQNTTGLPSNTVVNFTIPTGSVLFTANRGYYCSKPTYCNNGSANKIFNVFTTTVGNIPAGTISNDGTGSLATTFSSLPIALGYTDSNTNPTTPAYPQLLQTTFDKGISKNELNSRGFITSNGVLRFKLVHIPSGVGYANISVTCGVSCYDSSSSSGALEGMKKKYTVYKI